MDLPKPRPSGDDVSQIKQAYFHWMKDRASILIIKSDYGFEVAQWLETGGVAPTSNYDTAQEAAARVLQLLKIKEPITPQTWPEIAQIGGPPSAPPPRTPSVES